MIGHLHRAAIGTGATLLALSCAAAVVAAPAAGAGPTSPRTTLVSRDDAVAGLKAVCDAQIDRRLVTLGELQAAAKADVVTPAHQSSLGSELTSEVTGLQGLKAQIDAGTQWGPVHDQCETIVTAYRVYVLEVPTVWLTTAADTEVQAATTLQAGAPKLADLIAAAKARGKDTTQASAQLADLNAKVIAARSLATPVGDAVIAVTPQQVDGATGGPVLVANRAAVGTAADDLRAAATDAHQIIDGLRS
jgi:hypothetical protein